jgi:mRNA-degrading endonuclease HigB of HigAB toxin-antitoxin module
MRLIGREKLCCLSRAEQQVKKWVQGWTAEVANANWKHPAEICAQFPNARQTEDGRFLFPIDGCARAVSMLIAFPQGIALITALEDTDEPYGS